LTGLGGEKEENVAPEEQEYDNKRHFKEMLDTVKTEEKPKDDNTEKVDKTNEDGEKLKDIAENSGEDEKEKDDDDDEENSDSDEEGTEKKGTYNLAGMTKEEKKAHKVMIKEENREKRKNKMKKYDKNR
jgi:hypothetical protein